MSYRFLDVCRARPFWSCSTAVYTPVWHIPLLSVQWINSWWWTDELSETCRVSWQNKFVKLVHLFGFITKKFVTMHGHKNLKKDGLNFRAQFSGNSTDALARMGPRKTNLTECKPKISKELLNSSYTIRNFKLTKLSVASLHPNNSHLQNALVCLMCFIGLHPLYNTSREQAILSEVVISLVTIKVLTITSIQSVCIFPTLAAGTLYITWINCDDKRLGCTSIRS
jgi:hypothetical protein